MIVLADNDILLKLAGCDLLQDFLDMLRVDENDIRLAPETRYSICAQANKLLADASVAKSLLSFVEKLQEAPAVSDIEWLNLLSEIPGIDTGEAMLLAVLVEHSQSRLATGDRRALRALLAHTNRLGGLVEAVRGRIFTLELVLIQLIQTRGFDYVSERVIGRVVQDQVLSMAFGPGRSEAHAMECLQAYSKEVQTLLSEQHCCS